MTDKLSMHNCLLCLYLLIFCLIPWGSRAETFEDKTLEETAQDFSNLKKDLDALLKLKVTKCAPEMESCAPTDNNCDIKAICSSKDIHMDRPILYENGKGQKVRNAKYFRDQENLINCLREKYSDEIKTKREDLTNVLGTKHLQAMKAANKKLLELTNKHNQGKALSKISGEILNISIERGLNGESTAWSETGSSKNDLNSLIAEAEKKTGLRLVPEIKKTLVEIQFLKNNHLYKQEVEAMDEALFPETKITDPLYNWKLLTDESAAGGKKALADNRSDFNKKVQNAYELFTQTQSEMLKYLESKKTEKNLIHMERAILRVKTIKFNIPRLTSDLVENCTSPNAFYSAESHAFTICPQYLDHPKMALMETIAHEMAHSFDSCNLSGNFYKYKKPEIVLEAPFELDIKTTTDPYLYSNTRGEEARKINAKNKIQTPMKYADHPFSSTMSCLESSKSVGAKVSDIETLRAQAKERLLELERRGATPENQLEARMLAKFIAREKDYFDNFRGCNNSNLGDTLGRSQMQEAIADKIATEVISREMKKQTSEEAKNSMLELVLGYSDMCARESKPSVMLRDFALKNGCPNYIENRSIELSVLTSIELADPAFDTHSENYVRIEKNLMAHPDIRRALKCPFDKGVIYCE